MQYVNDSKATNVDACWYALDSMKTPTILILGGKDKGNDYNEIKELVKEKCKALVFLGADNKKPCCSAPVAPASTSSRTWKTVASSSRRSSAAFRHPINNSHHTKSPDNNNI